MCEYFLEPICLEEGNIDVIEDKKGYEFVDFKSLPTYIEGTDYEEGRYENRAYYLWKKEKAVDKASNFNKKMLGSCSDRHSANLQILTELSDAVREYPNLRFSQIMCELGVVEGVEGKNYWKSDFYLEPDEILARINNNRLI